MSTAGVGAVQKFEAWPRASAIAVVACRRTRSLPHPKMMHPSRSVVARGRQAASGRQEEAASSCRQEVASAKCSQQALGPRGLRAAAVARPSRNPSPRRGLPKRRASILSLRGRVSSGGDLRYIPTHSLLYLHRGVTNTPRRKDSARGLSRAPRTPLHWRVRPRPATARYQRHGCDGGNADMLAPSGGCAESHATRARDRAA